MLRIAEHWYASDLGRQRQGNEDNFFVRAPLFVVADGMGGAQAGEVASEIAVRSFDDELPGDSKPDALVSVIEQANKRIHERARADESLHGMGTTTTAAYVDDDEVVIAHVGDSRAYLLRDGELVRLTKDHSLVGELVARGKLTEEQAEQHPQRSVITRALGPEANVQVDIDIFPAKPGDLFLLCSDGLTSMVHEPKLRPLFEDDDSLETLGKRLIDAANAAGGRDNITVILFRLEAVEPREGEAAAAAAPALEEDTSEYDTFEGEAVRPPRQGVTRADADTKVGDDALTSAEVADAVEDDYRRSGTVALSAIQPGGEPTAAPEEPPPQAAEEAPPRRTAPLPADSADSSRKRRRRVPVGLIIVFAIVALILVGGWMATRAVYFVGTDPRDDRTIAIFRGLPYDLPLGIELYERYAGSGVTIDDVPPARRATFTDHKLRSKDDAENLVIALERGQIE
ncbi:MAG TPA: Stp1/IreP family PP2C-type Ser/Thr phosphatase [Solirubrobacteraceae bacterium]|nr:Stp1/IreP family PP2C-type Ser/Thr phosphatase [Solirubrobacteraceae bacterium]